MKRTRENKMNKERLKNLNNQRAITLIALVVTIVVLLVLAGVSLNLVLGNNGIINKSKEAKEANKKATAAEEVHLYWGDVQIDYNDTIEQKVESLQNLLKTKDADATATLQTDSIEVKYKGYNFALPYIDTNSLGEIRFFSWFVTDAEKYAVWYITEDSKVCVLDSDNNKICINDKFPELSNETNLRYTFAGGSSAGKAYNLLLSDKRVWSLQFNTNNVMDLESYTLEKAVDLETIDGGKYKNNNIRAFFEGIVLDDGKFYGPNEDKLEQIPIAEDIKIKNISGIQQTESVTFLVIDENGKMNTFSEDSTTNISETLYNGFFSDKNIKTTNLIRYNNEGLNLFITEDGKAYIENNEKN